MIPVSFIIFVLFVFLSLQNVKTQEENHIIETSATTASDNTTNEQQTCDVNGVCIAKAQAKVPKYANEQGKPPEVNKDECNDRHENCNTFFQNGECTKNPGWMIVNCPHSCSSCHLRDAKVRCQRASLNISTEPAYYPGQLHAMFEQIPEKFAHMGVTVLSTSPYIMTFDNFVTDEEITALLMTATNNGKTWERSTDTGSVNEFGETGRVISQGRTSSNAWCRHNCESHPAVTRLAQRIEEVIGVPRVNAESFQVLRYVDGQKYSAHHDMSP